MATIEGTEGDDDGIAAPALTSLGWATTIFGRGGDDLLTSGSRLFDLTPDALHGGTGNDTYAIAFPVVYPIYSTPIIWAYFEGNADIHEAISAADLEDRLVLNEGFTAAWTTIRFDGADLLITGLLGLTQQVRVVEAYGVDDAGRLASGLDLLRAWNLPEFRLTEAHALLPFLLVGTEGDDTLDATAATLPRILDGRGGNDLLLGGAGIDLIAGGEGADTIHGGAGADRAHGGAGDDSIDGGAGADALHGMAGDDRLEGGGGDDSYHHAGAGDGFDSIADAGGTADRILFGPGITAADLLLAREGDDLRIALAADPGQGVLVLGQFAGTGGRIESLAFAGGGVLDLAAAANAAPVAAADALVAVAGRATSGNLLADNGAGADADPDGDALSVVAGRFRTEAGGRLTIAADGSFTYRAATGFLGSDGFDYALRDALGAEATGRLQLEVVPNLAPVARKDRFATAEDSVLHGNVLADNGFGADTDGNGDALTVRAATLTTALGATVTLAADGSFTYQPPADAAGADSFVYRVVDGFGGVARGRVSITVTPVADAPEARTDVLAGSAVATLSGNLLADNGRGADRDADGDALSVQPASLVTARGGVVEIAADGSFTYRNMDGHVGTDSFAYTLRDATGLADAGSVSLTLSAPPGALLGTAADNTMAGTAAADLILALGGDDRITAGDGADTVYGGAGSDRIEAGRGHDRLFGGQGNDRLEGEGGDDTLTGGLGLDTLEGGDGGDTFVFLRAGDGADLVQDFRPGEGDRLDLAALLAGEADPLAALRLLMLGPSAVLEVNLDGGGFVPVATLLGGAGLPGLATLAAEGALLLG